MYQWFVVFFYTKTNSYLFSFSKDKNTNFPNIQKLKNEFTNIKLEQLFDYQKQLAFGVFCLQENEENLNRLLQIDFNDYFEPIL